MPDHNYKFYECQNPDCALRFPGYEGVPRWNRCPICRSITREIEQANLGYNPGRELIPGDTIHISALLDNIRSAMNVGSIIRTSDGLGIEKIYLCGISATPDNEKVRKTSLGAEANIAWEKCNNAVSTAQQLKTEGNLLWVLEGIPGNDLLYDIKTPRDNTSIVLVIGNEVCGVDPGIIKLCDKVISIPMLGEKSSYNVAIAYGIVTSFLQYLIWTELKSK